MAKLTIAQKVEHGLESGHRVVDIMRVHKVSYAFVHGIHNDMRGIRTPDRPTVNGIAIRCGCGSSDFSRLPRTTEYECMDCGGQYTGDQ